MNAEQQIINGTMAFLKAKREEFHYSQADVAKMLPYNLTGYNQLEKGHKFLTLIQIWQVARVYKITPGEVINGIYGGNPSEEKSKLEQLQAKLDAVLEENSSLKNRLIEALTGGV
jgi:transcriptional regulator with XRE-family HTH domain